MHILRVSPCSEFRVRDELHRMGLLAYVPVEFQTSRFGRGKEGIRKAPVVRGYVFAAIQDWHALRAIREVKGAVCIGDRPAALTGAQTAALELLSRPLARANRSGWSPGDIAKVRKGAWAEFEAVVREVKRGKVVATVHLFGRPMDVTLAAEQLEAA